MASKKAKYTISNACILCQNCFNNCPKKAISLNTDDFKYEINQDSCIACGLCHRNCVYRAIIKEDNK